MRFQAGAWEREEMRLAMGWWQCLRRFSIVSGWWAMCRAIAVFDLLIELPEELHAFSVGLRTDWFDGGLAG